MASLGDFLILSKIGEGAFSSVHKVKRISDGNIYALKKVKITTMKEKQKENSLNQVRILASITNDNIIGYKQAFFDQKANALCIIMEFAQGGDLEKIIEKKKKNLAWVPESQIWTMIKQVLTGLSLLHDMNIIHRDIKCANIFVSNGIYKLGDLNVSKLLKQNLAYTQTGTPYYASPEVWNDKPYELKSDIWSLGCIIYEYCALKPPFTATSMQGLYKKVMRGIYARIPAIYSQRLQKFINKCLQLQAKNRPNCKQLMKLLPDVKQISTIQNNSNVNLLDTIRVPRDLQSWREQLPKSNYLSELDVSNKETRKKIGFGNFSQQKLKALVKQKNPEVTVAYKKSSIRRITPDIYSAHSLNNELSDYNMHQNQNKNILLSALKERELEKIKKQREIEKQQQKQLKQIIKKNERTQFLPKIKVHSEPTDNSLISRMREQDRRKYNYNRPVWWG